MRSTIGTFASTTLAGRKLSVPGDLSRPTLLVFAYQQRQQRDVDTWLAAVAGQDVDVLEVPVLGRRWRPARRFIDGGMASNMDQPTREQTMCVYTDVDRFRRDVLGVTSREVLAVLVDVDGRVRWWGGGRAEGSSASELIERLERG